MDQNTAEKLAKSLTADTTELIPFLPYLLQDLWELGSSPKDIVNLMSQHINMSDKMRVLDLACGKGAVSVGIAGAFGCKVIGIDLMPEFIQVAVEKALEFGVGDLCEFMVEDIHEAVDRKVGYDIVIFGAVGKVLGSPQETLVKLKQTVKPGGYVVIDDGYAKSESDLSCLTKHGWQRVIQKNGLRMVADLPVEDDTLLRVVDEQLTHIAKRVDELKKLHPEKSELFDSYLQSQREECDELENEILGVTMLLQVIG